MCVLIASLGVMILATVLFSQPYSKTLARYHGMTERGYNRGPFIDTANTRYAYLAAPYCASGLSVMLDRLKAAAPRTRTARARGFVTAGSTDARRVYNGRDTAPVPSIAVWTRPGGGGHVALVLGVTGHTLHTFEFNTSQGVRGSQWNGEWSGYRTRSWSDMSPLRAMRITHFTPVQL